MRLASNFVLLISVGGAAGCTADVLLSADRLPSPEQAGPAAHDPLPEPTVPIDCDDSNPCTADTLEPLSGVCQHRQRTGPCDDADACTSGDTCQAGLCVGEGLTCADADPCTRDLCDPQTGCLHPPLDCADADPCTEDSCDPQLGCVHAPVAGMVPCGFGDVCAPVSWCIDGACRPFPAEDTTPCGDGNLCSLANVCFAGECGPGTATATPIRLPVFGGSGSHAAVMPDGRMVFVPSWSTELTTVAVVAGDAGRAEPLATTSLWTEIAGRGVQRLLAIDAEHVAALVATADLEAYEPSLRLLRWDADGRLSERGAIDDLQLGELVVAGQGVLYGCERFATTLQIVDARDPESPLVAPPFSLPSSCEGLALAGLTSTLWVVGPSGLTAVDVSDPFAPVVAGDQLATAVAAVATNGVRLAAAPEVSPGEWGLVVFSPGTITAISTERLATPPLGMAWLAGGLLVVTASSAILFDSEQLIPIATTEIEAARLEAAGPEIAVYAGELGELHLVRASADDSTPLRTVTSPHHGSVHYLKSIAGLPVLVSRDSSRRLVLDDPDAPRLEAGGVFAVAGDHLLGYGPNGGSPLHFVPGSGLPWAEDAQRARFASWLDMSEPAAVTPLGEVSFASSDGAYGRTVTRGDGRYLYALVDAGTAGAEPAVGEALPRLRLEIYDLAQQAPGSGVPLVPLASLGLADILPLSDAMMRLAIDPSGDTLAAVVSGDYWAGEDLVESFVGVWIVAVAPVEAPALVAEHWHEAWLPAAVFDAAIAGDLLVTVGVHWQLGGNPQLGLARYEVERATGQLVDDQTLAVEGARHLLSFDPSTALVATDAGATVVDVAGAGLAILGEVSLAAPAVAGGVFADRLVIADRGGVTILGSPCAQPSP